MACAINSSSCNSSSFNSSAKVNATSTVKWSCSSTTRTMAGNGIPDHPVTTGSFATPIGAQNLNISFRMTPTLGAAAVATANPGYALNSVKFDPATAGSCTSNATSINPGGGCVAAMDTDPWRLEAIGGAFQFGTDESNVHGQPNGQYHYHGPPEAYLFTVAHSITLTLGMLNMVRIPTSIVEPLILASIALMFWLNKAHKATNLPTRAAIVFACGLLHGLGFASSMADAGLHARTN